MKSAVAIFTMITAGAWAAGAMANIIDPNDLLPNWIWPTLKLIGAIGTAGTGAAIVKFHGKMVNALEDKAPCDPVPMEKAPQTPVDTKP